MSFRTRLTLFFVLIVIVPMVALGVVVARLVTDSEEGKANARAGAHAAAATTVYERAAEEGARAAEAIGADRVLAGAIRRGDRRAARTRARLLAREHELVRLLIVRGASGTGAASGTAPDRGAFVDLGTPLAIGAGSARIRSRTGGVPLADVEASTIDASQFVRTVRAPGVEVVVRRGGRLLASTLPAADSRGIPARGDLTRGGTDYVVAGFRAADFAGSEDTVSLLTDVSGTASTVTRNRRLAIALLAGFLLLALLGAVVVSRQLQRQIGRFLTAARRIGGGDFSTRVPTEGGDEFAELGSEFNKMSQELEQRIDDLRRERGRLRDSIQRVGETFASNLDRRALIEIGTETAVEAVEASCGRTTLREPDEDAPDGTAAHSVRVGDVERLATVLEAAEARARAAGAPADATAGDASALASPIPRALEGAAPHGIVAVARSGRRFDEEERALLGSLAAQTGISLENVELHDQVKRQAVTDELTGLFNHRRFQEVMTIEVAAAQRFGQPLGLLMIDIDNFKQVNDTYGHQQGDVVLKDVARILQDSSREIDEPARYGGEEMAVALPQTDLDGAFTIAERVRTAVEALAVPRLDGEGVLRVTVSCGVASSASSGKDELVAAADVALYTAKRTGKNKTVRATDAPAMPVETEQA